MSSSNSIYVLDAKGTPYYFSAKTGCMFDKNNNNGPANFCLTPSTSQSSGYMLSGSTGCANPASNTACNIANFAVVLTNNPSGAGCIAVLGTGGSSPTAIAGSIAVVDADGSFTIGGGTAATAYKTYWNGAIPICGGNNIYAGTYTSTNYSASGWTTANGSCVLQSPPPTTRSGSLTLTIDSGGIIDSETSKVIGIVASNANTTTMQAAAVATGSNCTPGITIASVTKSGSGKWAFSGTETFAGVSTPFTMTQN
ncbi:MAG TPA: hypothetical protein VMU62_10240 [Acidobacteriaceae bacterium]|nr:hypothetical protein [Acidobacteriaceae bacterium]